MDPFPTGLPSIVYHSHLEQHTPHRCSLSRRPDTELLSVWMPAEILRKWFACRLPKPPEGEASPMFLRWFKKKKKNDISKQPNYQNKCWQSMFLQNQDDIKTLHFVGFGFSVLCCAYHLVRISHNTHLVRVSKRSRSARKITHLCLVSSKHAWRPSLKNIQRWHTSKCWIAFSNCSKWIGSFLG